MGRASPRRCDRRCRDAKGADCKCLCSGRYHGRAGGRRLLEDLGMERVDGDFKLEEADFAEGGRVGGVSRLIAKTVRPRTGRARRRRPSTRQAELPLA